MKVFKSDVEIQEPHPACEAGVSIKPWVEQSVTQGLEHNKDIQPANAGGTMANMPMVGL